MHALDEIVGVEKEEKTFRPYLGCSGGQIDSQEGRRRKRRATPKNGDAAAAFLVLCTTNTKKKERRMRLRESSFVGIEDIIQTDMDMTALEWPFRLDVVHT